MTIETTVAAVYFYMQS